MNSRRLIASTEAQDKASYRLKITLGMGRPMSALGQKRTYAVRKGMSALRPIATVKADRLQMVMSALHPKANIPANRSAALKFRRRVQRACRFRREVP
jgi:hypothetical protein